MPWTKVTTAPTYANDGAAWHKPRASVVDKNGFLYNLRPTYNGTFLERWDPATGVWTKLAQVPNSPTEGAAFFYNAYNHAIYVAGGNNAAGTRISWMYRYDVATDTFVQSTNFGYTPTGPIEGTAGAQTSASVWVAWDNYVYLYDPLNDNWPSASTVPGGISEVGLAYGFGRITVSGGWGGSAALDTSRWLTPYPLTGGNQDSTPLPVAMRRHREVYLGGQRYLVRPGGTLYRQQAANGAWENLGAIPATVGDWPAVAASASKIYVTDSTTREVWEYVPNEAPNAPALSTPVGGTVIDRANVNRFSWTFSDNNAGDTQSKYDLRYRLAGAATWTDVTATTPNQYWDAPAGTFLEGDYEWQARTYDAQGLVGAWSGSGFYSAGTKPATPTITDPINGSSIPTPTRAVTWSTPVQDAYQLQVQDGVGGLVYDTAEVVSEAARSRIVDLPTNNVTRTIRVRVKDAGLWSDWYAVTVTVSYTPPPVPGVALVVSGTALLVQVTNPAPSGSEPAVVENRVYVDDGQGEELRARVAPGATWPYWTARSGVDYEGRVRVVAVADNGTEAASS